MRKAVSIMHSISLPGLVIQRPTFSWVEESLTGTNETYRMLRACSVCCYRKEIPLPIAIGTAIALGE